MRISISHHDVLLEMLKFGDNKNIVKLNFFKVIFLNTEEGVFIWLRIGCVF
jgi:hypothetical protein